MVFTVRLMSAFTGECYTMEVYSCASVFDLKRSLRTFHGVRKQMVTVIFNNTVLSNASLLYEFRVVASWFYIADLCIDEHLIPFEVKLDFVVCSRLCDGCAHFKALRECGRCRDACYCSINCQRAAWRSHRFCCIPVSRRAACNALLRIQ